ncbi:SDR family oxidoreductase [Psychrosphaera aestuarii]|uniref:SDR family oxidoreductase n=1 Tax=Psychrosphaera aestuarii TaxID=1266052 RepID=UPI001B33A380|nr:SDR family oxidoreductase [Psychrosphaera aestuarii]
MKKTRYLITGGASGLGKSLALALAKQNQAELKICIADVNDERGEAAVKELTNLGAEAFYQRCDITDMQDVSELYNAVNTKWQGVDVVYNNAGVATGGSLQSESIEQWQWILDVNLLGMVRVSQVFLEGFKAQGHGHFVNIASQAGLTPIPLMSSYNSVKSAVIALSETMKLELAQYNVDVSVVCPSFFKTNLDESLRTSEASVGNLMNKLFERAKLSSDQVAQTIVNKVNQGQFLILTHKEGIKAYRLKKLMPINWYLSMMLKQTKALLKKGQSLSREQ